MPGRPDQDDVAAALAAARRAVGADADARLAWRRVERLDDRPGYLLVGIGSGESGVIVAVGIGGEVQTYAADPAGADAWWTDAAGDLVWRHGSWSRSPLYPLRRVIVDGAEMFFDHDGVGVPLERPGRG